MSDKVLVSISDIKKLIEELEYISTNTLGEAKGFREEFFAHINKQMNAFNGRLNTIENQIEVHRNETQNLHDLLSSNNDTVNAFFNGGFDDHVQKALQRMHENVEKEIGQALLHVRGESDEVIKKISSAVITCVVDMVRNDVLSDTLRSVVRDEVRRVLAHNGTVEMPEQQQAPETDVFEEKIQKISLLQRIKSFF